MGIVEPDDELRSAASKDPVYQGLSWLTRDELLATPGLQAVLVETRIRDLLDHAEACIQAGKHIHLDKPAGDSLPQDRGEYKKGTQEIRFPKYIRYVGDAADMAQIIRGEKSSDFPPEHDVTVQATLLRACGQKVE